MRKKFIVILILIFVFVYNGIARKSNFNKTAQCATFFKNGDMVSGIINFMSTRHPKIGFINQGRFNLNKVWMLNFISEKWNFPRERKQLSKNSDTVFLKNGEVFYDKVTTFSTKFKVFRFRNTNDIHVSKIKRIYFCCMKLPRSLKENSNNINEFTYTTIFADGKTKNKDIEYYNKRKTGFVDGLQVNTKDIRMINFENKKKNFPDENRYLKPNLDTVFLKNGDYIQQNIYMIDFKSGKIEFQDESEVNLKKVIRIYFKGYHRNAKNPVRRKKFRREIR